jgi:tetratricopeptide (TPR) repeat protein
VLKYILLPTILAFIINLQASVLQDKYQEALLAYKAKKFEESFNLFSSIYIQRLSDKRLNFYFGRSAFETGHYETALAAFERVSILDPDNIRNTLEMARTYFMLQMFEDSERLFRSALAHSDLPLKIRNNIELYLAEITADHKQSYTYLSLSTNWVYDSNVNYGSSKDKYYNALLGIDLDTTSPISDSAKEFSVGFTNIYIINPKGGFAIRNSLTAYKKEYETEKTYDVLYLGYAPSFIYRNARYSLGLNLNFDTLTLNDVDFLHTYSISSTFGLNHSSTLSSLYSFKFQSKYFQQDAQIGVLENSTSLDTNRYELIYGLQKVLSPSSQMQINLIGTKESDTRSRGNFVSIYANFEEYKLNMTYAKQFSSIFAIQLLAETYKRKYKDKSTIFTHQLREDDEQSLSIVFNTNVVYGIKANLKASYTTIDSNQEIFAYEKNTLALGLNKTF